MLRDPYRLHLWRAFIHALASAMAWTSVTVYSIQVIGMTPFQLVIVGTALEVTIFLCEVPTGIVADLYSRRLSVIIGTAVVGLGYVLMGAIPQFSTMFAGHVLWGIGATFLSGAYDAWLVDEIGIERAGPAFLRAEQVARVATAVGIVGSALLGVIALAIPVATGGALLVVLSGLLTLFMRETGFRPAERAERTTWGKMGATFREGFVLVRSRPTLGRILAVGLFYGLFSEAWDRLWQAHLLETFKIGALTWVTPVVFIAALRLLEIALSVTVAEYLRRRLDTTNVRHITGSMFVMTLVMVLALVVYGIAPYIAIALLAYIFFTVSRQLISPLFTTWINGEIHRPHVRATVISMSGQADAIGQMVGGPPLGTIGTWSLRAAFVASSVLLSPVLPLLRTAHPPATVEEVVAAE